MSLNGKTIFISGASRGIGLAIALRAARDGANVALIAKTAEPHPKLEGTVYTAAEQIEAAGGHALPIVGDIRDEQQVADAVAQAVERFGGIDVCVNNASAINLARTEELDMKRYTLAKYGMSLVALGLAAELREDGIASNALWPRTLVATAAVQNLLGGDEAMARARRPEVYADAAYAILNRPARECTGNAFLCEDVLVEEGVTDLSQYSYVPGAELAVDLFVDAADPPAVR
jgi:citronellol/citronellal dehydrogenase